MNNNSTLYTKFKFYFNMINTHKKIGHLIALHILFSRFFLLNFAYNFAILIFLHEKLFLLAG